MLSFLSLISGSSGNAAFISDGKTNLLIDCGMSGRRLKEALASIDVSTEDLSAILVTHEHTDHTKGVGVVARRYGIPVYATAGTLQCMDTGKIDPALLNTVTADTELEIGSIGIRPFTIPHDAAEPVGYSFFIDQKKYTLATDIGHINEYLMTQLQGSHMILLESNHDIDMLKTGSYPYYLKQRILGSRGHLSNDAASQIIPDLVKSGTEHIMLGHLSRENNLPEIAKLTSQNVLDACGIHAGTDVTLTVADRYQVTRFAV